MNPRVTILIANRDYGKYLGDAIDSALEQTYTDINIAVVDDGSSDDSWKVIHNKMFKNIPHNKLVLDDGVEAKVGTLRNIQLWAVKLNNPSGFGPSYARNYAIERWINQSFAFQILDADDIMAPQKVEKLLNKMMQSPQQIGAVYADYHNLNVETNLSIREYKEPFDKNRLYNECIVHSGSMISSLALSVVKNQNGYYDNTFRVCEDYQLWCRISRNFMIVHVPESLTTVRVHPNNSTLTVNKEIWLDSWNRIRQMLNNA